MGGSSKFQLGFTLMELLVAIAMSSIVICSTLVLFRSGLQASSRFQRDTTLIQNTVYISSVIQQILEDLDSHRLKIFPRVTNGLLVFTNGAKIGTSLKPSPNASVVFNHELCRMLPIQLSNRRLEAGGTSANSCFVFKDECSPSESLGAVALTPSGLFEVNVDFEPNQGPCRKIHLRTSKGLVLQGLKNTSLLSASKLAPIKRSYAILTDSKNTLRFLGFKGDTLVENQPIRDRSEAFRVNFQPNTSGIVSAEFSVKDEPRKFFLTAILGHYDHFNSLFE